MKLTNLFKKQQIKTVDPIVIPTVESLDPKRWCPSNLPDRRPIFRRTSTT